MASKKYRLVFNILRRQMSYPGGGAWSGFINQGSANVYINQMKLIPGAFFFPPDPPSGEEDNTDYNITADNATAVIELLQIKKVYT